ncbi:LysR substrate-binding domain-containing protein [Roseomonas sp. NAR14]|uniref:LysR substrate-binding domain-containing protein n=1 Tax=Roseomonas acroporae TaxID=2937791 RepID=A0A9X1YHF1_9PROT|nr:LysR substrate-binding domain-containing protein [Roseomonas acroporae]
MELDWLGDFLALAAQRNFSRAADSRNVTQPAFSRRIRALEDWIGTPLFRRGAQGAELTEAGAHLRPLAEDLLARLHRARQDTRALGERGTATLAIAATHALSFTFFPGWIRRQARLEALGTVNLVSDSLEACEALMLGGEAHFLLCHHHPDAPNPLDPARFPSRAVGTDTLVAACAPAAGGGPAWRLDDAAAPRLAYSPASGLGRILAACRGDARRGGTAPRLTSHLAAALLTLAREGHGIAWLPLTVAGEDLASGRLVRAGPPGSDLAVGIRLFRAPGPQGRAAEALWESLGDAADG